LARPANAPAESNGLRALARVGESADVSATDAEHVGDGVDVEQGRQGRRDTGGNGAVGTWKT
jgi:hypothetical protein